MVEFLGQGRVRAGAGGASKTYPVPVSACAEFEMNILSGEGKGPADVDWGTVGRRDTRADMYEIFGRSRQGRSKEQKQGTEARTDIRRQEGLRRGTDIARSECEWAAPISIVDKFEYHSAASDSGRLLNQAICRIAVGWTCCRLHIRCRSQPADTECDIQTHRILACSRHVHGPRVFNHALCAIVRDGGDIGANDGRNAIAGDVRKPREHFCDKARHVTRSSGVHLRLLPHNCIDAV